MTFEKELKRCQYERGMTNDAFAKYLGKSRTWLQTIYSNNPNKFGLTGLTMFELHDRLGIANELMEEYNSKYSKPRMRGNYEMDDSE
jgi:hypothetical protein